MEKEKNQNNPSTDQNQDTVKETSKPEENLAHVMHCLHIYVLRVWGTKNS